jgi:putative resolvase
LVESSAEAGGRTVAYCRVSSAEKRDDLERQAGRVAEEAGKRGITLDATVTEVGSGVNGNLAKLGKILADPRVSRIVVEHRDRLARFGVEHLEAALSATGRRIIVLNQDELNQDELNQDEVNQDEVNQDEVTDDLVRDMIEVLTSMCARRYGRRSARRRAEAGVRCVTAEVVAE